MNKTGDNFFFFLTLAVTFVLLEHNGTEPLFILAYAAIPFLIIWCYKKPNYLLIVIYLLLIGTLGRYTRYFRENYASDTLLAIRDYIGYFVHGKNVYKEIIWANAGLTPFTYLPFTIFWYLPAYILHIDFRFFEMLVSCLVPIAFFLYSKLKATWQALPFLAIVSVTPFLLDLSADGSNDNSAIFLLLFALLLFSYGIKKKNKVSFVISAFVFACSASFKHYIFFFLPFFIPYLLQLRNLPITTKKYVAIFLGSAALITGPFVLASPLGFFKSLFFIEYGNYHKLWGWNIWVALNGLFLWTPTDQFIWVVRTVLTITTIIVLFVFVKTKTLKSVILCTVVTMFVYLAFSKWTTFAYFTFLVPLLCLIPLEDLEQKKA